MSLCRRLDRGRPIPRRLRHPARQLAGPSSSGLVRRAADPGSLSIVVAAQAVPAARQALAVQVVPVLHAVPCIPRVPSPAARLLVDPARVRASVHVLALAHRALALVDLRGQVQVVAL